MEWWHFLILGVGGLVLGVAAWKGWQSYRDKEEATVRAEQAARLLRRPLATGIVFTGTA